MAGAGERYIQWVTLFDHPDDDTYDGTLGEDDDETPRIKVEIVVEDGGAIRANESTPINMLLGTNQKNKNWNLATDKNDLSQ
jgi:hypothetical protein